MYTNQFNARIVTPKHVTRSVSRIIEVQNLLSRGHTVTEIAEMLGSKPSTIATMMRRNGLSSQNRPHHTKRRSA